MSWIGFGHGYGYPEMDYLVEPEWGALEKRERFVSFDMTAVVDSYANGGNVDKNNSGSTTHQVDGAGSLDSNKSSSSSSVPIVGIKREAEALQPRETRPSRTAKTMESQSASSSSTSSSGACPPKSPIVSCGSGESGKVGAYSPEERKERIRRFLAKRSKRVWRRTIKYDCRKKLADGRPRIKGRFVKREEEENMGDESVSDQQTVASTPDTPTASSDSFTFK